jgi:hypothetical protein
LATKKRRKAVSKKTQKSKFHQKIDWSTRKAPKKNSKLRAEYEKSQIFKKRSKAAKSVNRKPKTHSTERALKAEIRSLKKVQKKLEESAKRREQRNVDKILLKGLRVLGVKDFIKALKITKGMRRRAYEKFLAMNREAIESFAIYEDVPLKQIYEQIFGY